MATVWSYCFLLFLGMFCIGYGAAMTVDEMWNVLEKGDKNREEHHLQIDGNVVNQKPHRKREIKEFDILQDDDYPVKRQSYEAITDWHKELWRTREIPYTSVFSGADQTTIVHSMGVIAAKTCLTFRPKTSSDKQWLNFYRGVGCFSGIGRRYWKTASTDISLGTNCVNKAIVIHEILHALGFPHEQSRTDRSSYVNSYIGRVSPGMKSNFDKARIGDYNYEGTAYDIKSIMQYGRTAFGNGGVTMEYKFDTNMPLGGIELSETDIIELNRHYQCDVQSGWSNWSKWTPCMQKTWGNRECTKAKVRFCISLVCPDMNEFGVQEIVEVCTTTEYLNPSIDGHWGTWSSYSKCSGDCGWGYQTKSRECNSPKESNGGKPCEGNFLSKFLCRNPRCAGYESIHDANFEEGFGNWITDKFTIRSGSGSRPNTGPTSDVSGQGKYAVLSLGGIYVNTGKLTSPMINAHPNAKKCLTYFYQLNGVNMQKLSVYSKDTANRYVNFPRLDGHQGNYWRRKAITINNMDNNYQIIFEGAVRGGQSEVAIDDIYLDSGECAKGLDDCKDVGMECESNAKNGNCDNGNKRRMRGECCATCSVCKDHNSSCQRWASEGYCRTNTWMLWNCCNSCYQKCQDSCSACEDNPRYADECPNWANNGECTKNPTWMSKNCKKSCSKC